MRLVAVFFSLLALVSLCLVIVAVVNGPQREVYGYMGSAEPEVVWSRTYGGEEGARAECIVSCIDGGYLLAGYTTSPEGKDQLYLIKVDANGEETWTRTYPGLEEVYDLATTDDGGFIVAGATNLTTSPRGKDLYLLKIDGSGNIVWTRGYGGTLPYSAAHCIVPSGDGSFVVGGVVGDETYGNDDLYLLKINGQGGTIWERAYDYNSSSEEARCIVQTGGGFVVAGIIWPRSDVVEDDDIYLLRIDGEGNKIWEKVYGTEEEDWPASIARTDGGFLVAGTTWYAFSDYEDTSDVHLVKTDGQGNMVLMKVFGTQYEYQGNMTGEEIHAMVPSDGGYVLAGEVDASYMYLVQIDGEGSRVWEKVFSDLSGYSSARDLVRTVDGGYVVAGSWEHEGDEDALLVKVKEGEIIPIPEFLPFLVLLALLPHAVRQALCREGM